jgi:hypothetical protein
VAHCTSASGVALIYISEDRGRVSMWISDRRSVHGSSRQQAPHSLAQPRVHGAALCIILPRDAPLYQTTLRTLLVGLSFVGIEPISNANASPGYMLSLSTYRVLCHPSPAVGNQASVYNIRMSSVVNTLTVDVPVQ